ncbi:MAG: hypothetical protein KBD78_04865 [Oligoflexales bacterium]|nr:hypothetical protein [Oligoflexales bacterium]
MNSLDRNNQSGTSLIQLVVAMGIIGTMLGFFLEIKKNSFNAREHMKADTDLRLIRQHVLSYLDCSATLSAIVKEDGSCSQVNFALLASAGVKIEDSPNFSEYKKKGWELRGNCKGSAIVVDASRSSDGKFLKDPLINSRVYDWNGPGKNLIDESMLFCSSAFSPKNANNFFANQYKLTSARTNFNGNLSNVRVGPVIKYKKNSDKGNLLVRFDTSFGFKKGNVNAWIQPKIKVSRAGWSQQRDFPKVGVSFIEDYAIPQSGSLRLSDVEAGDYNVEFLIDAKADSWSPPNAGYYDPVNIIVKESK